jgi:integrase/recombinase XerD
MVLTLLYSGFRISDAVKLARAKVNMQTGQLLIRMMKTGAPLYVRLPQIALDALAALPVESPYFFWSGKSKLSCAIGSARRTIDCLLNLAKVIDGHPHRFRDTFSVALLTNGTDLRTVQLLLGHTSIKTTEKHYAPFVVSMQRALDEAVSRCISA